MEVVFEFSKQFGTGDHFIVTHLVDNTIVQIFELNGDMVFSVGDYAESNPNSTIFSIEALLTNDIDPELMQNIRHSGGQNWLTWKSGTKQRVALLPESPYIMKPLFFKGFMAGVYSKEADEKDEDDTVIKQLEPQIVNEFGVDYWNGFIVGRLSYKQMYGLEV